MKKGDVKACMNEIAQAGTGPDVVREKSQYLMVLGKYEFMWHLSREQGTKNLRFLVSVRW